MIEIIQTINTDLGNTPQQMDKLGQEFETSSKSVKELRQDVKGLTDDINNLSASERAGTPGKVLTQELQAAQAELKTATDDIKKLTSASEEASTKTGNAFTKAFSAVRQLAYVLPGVGIAGILGGAATVIVDVLEEITSKTKDADIALKAYNDTIAATGKEIGNTTVEVQKMTTVFDEAKKGIVSKDTALIEYNKHFGDTLGTAKDYNTAEALFVSKSDAYVQAMQQRAIADAAYDLEKKAIAKSIEQQATLETSTFEKIKAGAAALFTGSNAITSYTGSIIESVSNDVKENNKLADAYHNIATKAQEAGDAIAKAAGINLYGNDKPKNGPKDNSFDEQQRYLDESQKILEDAQQKEITSENIKYQKIYDDLVAHNHSTEELDAQHQQNLQDIDTKYALKAEDEANKAFDQALLHKQERDEKWALHDKEEADKEAKALQDELDAEQAARDKAAVKALNAELEIGRLQLESRQLNKSQKLAILDQERKDVQSAYDKGLIAYSDYQKKIAQIDAAALKVKQLFSKEQEDLIHATEDLLTEGAEALGKNTAAGKDLAIAAATIKALEAEVNIISNLSETGPWGFVAGIAAAAAVGIGLFNTIKEIENVDIPGQGGGGSSSSASSTSISYTAPVIPQQINSTNLSAASIQQIQQQNSQPMRAYVVESDITNSQNTVRNYRNASRVGS